MSSINEQMKAKQAQILRERAKLEAERKKVGADEIESPSKMTSPEKKKFK